MRKKLVRFEEEKMGKIKKTAPTDMGHVSYKDIAKMEGTSGTSKEKEGPGWHYEHVEGNDWQGLSWILMMHAKEKIIKRGTRNKRMNSIGRKRSSHT